MGVPRLFRDPGWRRCAALLWAVLAGLMHTGAAIAQDPVELAKQLKEGDREIRREAVFQLRELGAGALPALPELIGALRDEDEQVAGRALTTIARIGPAAAEAVPALIEAMDPDRRRYDQQVMFRSAYALSEIGEAAVGPLRDALGGDRERKRLGAALALQLLGARAAPAVPELLVALHGDDAALRAAAAEALGAIGAAALEPLQRDLETSPSVAAVRAIGLVGKPAVAAGGQLLALDRGDAARYAAIIAALGAIEAPFEQIVTPLREALLHDSEGVQHAAADVLLSYPQPGAHSLPALKSWLGGSDAKLRSRAAWVIGQFGADAAALAPGLIGLLEKGESVEIVTAALTGLGPGACQAVLQAIAATPMESLRQQDGHWALSILRASGPLALPMLEEALGSEHAPVRFVALDALAAQGSAAKPLVPAFRKASNDPDAAVRLAALVALEAAGAEPQSLLAILHRRCADESGEVRAVALRLLGQVGGGDLQGLQLAGQALEDADPAVKLAAIGALRKFGAAAVVAVPELVALGEEVGAPAEKRLAILGALAAVGSGAADALPLVKRSLADPDAQIRGAAVAALVAIEPGGEGLTAVLVELLADKDQAVRHPAIDGLGQRGETAASAAPQLFELLDSSDDRTPALEALRKIRSQDVDLYIAALDNSDPRVRLFACEGLGRLGMEAQKAIPQLERVRRDRYDFVRERAEDAIRRIRR